MKDGECPKCGSSNVYSRNGEVLILRKVAWSWIYLDLGGSGWAVCEHDSHICTECGYYEDYLQKKDIEGEMCWKKWLRNGIKSFNNLDSITNLKSEARTILKISGI
jgi:predicted nucleic-acid-binding Zn-ribbon protein